MSVYPTDLAHRLVWALLSLAVIYAVGFYAAALIGGLAS